MSKKQKCYFCNGYLPGGHEIKGRVDARTVSACPAVNPKAMAHWERGYSDALDNKEEDLGAGLSYHDGYCRGEKEFRKISRSL